MKSWTRSQLTVYSGVHYTMVPWTNAKLMVDSGVHFIMAPKAKHIINSQLMVLPLVRPLKHAICI